MRSVRALCALVALAAAAGLGAAVWLLDLARASGRPEAKFGSPGPHSVGVRFETAAEGSADYVLWYPALAHEAEGLGYHELLPGPLRGLRGARYPTLAAVLDAAPDLQSAPCPVVLFSHGVAGWPTQSARLMEHLASWGLVVAAPAHRSIDLEAALSQSVQIDGTDVVRLESVLDVIEAESSTQGSELAGLADTTRHVVMGHSLGGVTAVRYAAAAQNLRAVVRLASGGDFDPAAPGWAGPTLYVAARTDSVHLFEGVEHAFENSLGPAKLLTLPEGGSLVFTDACELIPSTGTEEFRRLKASIPDPLASILNDSCVVLTAQRRAVLAQRTTETVTRFIRQHTARGE